MPYSIIQININNCTSNISKVKNGLNTPKIFHCDWGICRTILVNDAKRIHPFAVYRN